MWKDALLISLSCVLFIQMGLSDVIQHALRFRLRIISCPKCLTFWSIIAYLSITGHGSVVEIVAVSFLFAYLALWLALVYDALAALYNNLYEQITQTSDTSEEAPSGSGAPASNEVSEV